MDFFASTVDAGQILSAYGLAGLVMAVEAAVIIYFAKRDDSKQTKIDAIQEQRIVDARETRDKVMEPLEKQAIMGEKTYELLLNLTSRRGK